MKRSDITVNKENGPLVLLTASWPYGRGETFLESEIPYLTNCFKKVYVLPMFADGLPRSFDDRITLWPPTPPSAAKPADFFRGIRHSHGMFLAEWKRSHRFPLSPYGLYLTARTLGIARRIENRIISEVTRIIPETEVRKPATSVNTGPNQNDGAGQERRYPGRGIIYSYWMNQASIGAILAGKKLGWPVISRVHGGDLYTERYPGSFLPWHEWKVRNLNHLLPVSEFGQRYLQKRYPDASSHIKIFRLGVREPATDNANQTEANIAGPNQEVPFHMASCSSVISLKRVDRIMDTALALRKRWDSNPRFEKSQIQWTHIGHGAGWADLSKRVKNINLPGLNIRLTGHMPNEQITSYYLRENVNLLVNYSTSEGIPVSIMEAFSCGIPAAAPHTGGIPEIVNSSTGILFDSGAEPDKLAQLVDNAVQSGKLAKMGAAAKKKWEKEYHLETNYRRFMDFLSSILHS